MAMKAQIRVVADKIEKKAKGVTNSLAAYEGTVYILIYFSVRKAKIKSVSFCTGIIPDAPTDRFQKKKGTKGVESKGSQKKKVFKKK